MNRLEARNLVISNTGRSDKTTVINNALNFALDKISAQRLWSDLLTEGSATSVAGTGTIALASDVHRLAQVRLIDGSSSWPLTVRTPRWIGINYPNPSANSNGKPSLAYKLGSNLHLLPIPDAEYEFIYHYYRLHPKLDDDADEILIRPAESAVISFATYHTFKSIEQHESASQWFLDYETQVRDAKKVDSQNTAVELFADIRGEELPPPDFWNNPFIRHNP